MTKVVKLGPLSPIEFTHYLQDDHVITSGDDKPSDFDRVELICLEYDGTRDLMFAYNYADDRTGGTLYLGHFNDGVVE